MNKILTTHDVHMRYTASNGKTHVQEHRVWDSARFVTARIEEAKALNAKEDDATKRQHKAEQITESQYRSERDPRTARAA